VTVTIFTSTSEAKTGGYTFSILQLEASSFFNSKIDLNSSDDIAIRLFPFIQYHRQIIIMIILYSISSMNHDCPEFLKGQLLIDNMHQFGFDEK
jgi:hypothetical protein